jgi:hypothetical protein
MEPKEKKKEKEKKRRKAKKRLIRLVMIAAAAFLVFSFLKTWQENQPDKKRLFSSLGLPIRQKLENLGEDVLGAAVKHLPQAPALEELEEARKVEEKPKTEPIKEPTQRIQRQTEVLLEMIKRLPQDQVQAIKKQIYKEFCQSLLEEEND